MPKVRYSNKAVEDLSSIWEYTFTKWSENQADEYYAMLISACNCLLYPSVISNRSYEEISEGLLGVKAGHHLIFYNIKEQVKQKHHAVPNHTDTRSYRTDPVGAVGSYNIIFRLHGVPPFCLPSA